MTIYILLLLSLASLLSGVGVFVVQQYGVRKAIITRDVGYDGPEELRLALFAILRIFSRRIVWLRRLFSAHILHLFVLLMRFFDNITTHMYARSRDFFVKSAIKHKGTVPHFWEYLKTYKQEIDKEKEEKE